MTTHAKLSGDLMVIRYMEDFTDVVDHMTDQWENSNDKEAVFEFYTDSDDLKEKLLYLSTKQERGCFWDLYHCRGLEVEPIEGDVFHVVIDNITSKQDPILQFRKTVEKLTVRGIQLHSLIDDLSDGFKMPEYGFQIFILFLRSLCRKLRGKSQVTTVNSFLNVHKSFFLLSLSYVFIITYLREKIQGL